MCTIPPAIELQPSIQVSRLECRAEKCHSTPGQGEYSSRTGQKICNLMKANNLPKFAWCAISTISTGLDAGFRATPPCRGREVSNDAPCGGFAVQRRRCGDGRDSRWRA